MSWYVYMLECKGKRIYTGVAKDVQKRYDEHINGKGARFTKSFPPKKILHTMEAENYGQALKLEYAIKQLSKPQKQSLMKGKIHLGITKDV